MKFVDKVTLTNQEYTKLVKETANFIKGRFTNLSVMDTIDLAGMLLAKLLETEL